MPSTSPFFPVLQAYLANLSLKEVPAPRQPELIRLADYIGAALQAGPVVDLTFICTHNSRRSHFGQVWAATLAVYHGLAGIRTFSGGTEATACNPRTVHALHAAGFDLAPISPGDNPRYHLRYGPDHAPLSLWSKVYTDPANPQRGFGAIMTCDTANEACPVVLGAAARFAIMYEDPKAYDDTPQEAAAYATRCRQIAGELHWVMSRVKAQQTPASTAP